MQFELDWCSRRVFIVISLVALIGCHSGGKTSKEPEEAPPSIVSLTPSFPKGADQTLELIVSHPNGPDKVKSVQLMVSPDLSGGHACWLEYSPAIKQFGIRDDTEARFNAPAEGSGLRLLSNSQCSLDLTKAGATTDGSSLKILFPLHLSKSFPLPQIIFAITSTDRTHSGWKTIGTWAAP